MALIRLENNICSQRVIVCVLLCLTILFKDIKGLEVSDQISPLRDGAQSISWHHLESQYFSLSSFLAELDREKGLIPSSSLGSRQAGWQAFHSTKSCPAQFLSWLFPDLSHSLI